MKIIHFCTITYVAYAIVARTQERSIPTVCALLCEFRVLLLWYFWTDWTRQCGFLCIVYKYKQRKGLNTVYSESYGLSEMFFQSFVSKRTQHKFIHNNILF